MSAPDATGTRQRKAAAESTNPSSLSQVNPEPAVAPNKPDVKPPLADTPLRRVINYIVLGLVALVAFYIWRFTVWAEDAGGYWNLMTGARPPLQPATNAGDVEKLAIKNNNAAGTAGSRGGAPKQETVQDQIWKLAQALGVKPAELSAAIRPLVDPSHPLPGADQAAAAAKAAEEAATPGLMDVLDEIMN